MRKRFTQAEISAVMAEMGRKGGRIGAKRRLVTTTAKQRQHFPRAWVQLSAGQIAIYRATAHAWPARSQ